MVCSNMFRGGKETYAATESTSWGIESHNDDGESKSKQKPRREAGMENTAKTITTW